MKIARKRWMFLISLSVLVLTASLVVLRTHASLQIGNGEKKTWEERAVSVVAAGRGNPYVNFEDGRDLETDAPTTQTQPAALTTADFDSDGIKDVVTADASGDLQLLKGIDPSGFAIEPAARQSSHPEPFTALGTRAALDISPDYLFSGDLNADGRNDVLAAAKGGNRLVLVNGDGNGHFSQPVNIPVNGAVTAVEVGEIGRPDGQADVAVAYSNKDGSFLAVFEHPESAFKRPPEILQLPSTATAVAIGNTDEDTYSDIALACGNDLVVVHERGQAYPWDIFKDTGVTRPSAVVDVRRMAFSIESLAVGRFGENKGTSLALLSAAGNVYRIGPRPATNRPAYQDKRRAGMRAAPFVPTENTSRHYLMNVGSANLASDIDAFGSPMADRTARNGTLPPDRKAAEKMPKPDRAELERLAAVGKSQGAVTSATAIKAFILSISPSTSSVGSWQIEPLTSGSNFANASVGGKLTRVNVSDGNLDDLMVTTRGSKEIQFLSRQKNNGIGYQPEVSSLISNGGVNAVLPIRLNLDGLDDLVVLRQGSSTPAVVISAPMAIFFVDTTDDTTTCFPPDPCSLRGAILQANGNPGSDTIGFALPAGTTLAPASQLPSITSTLSIQGGNLPNGNKAIEISGDSIPAPADGIKIRTSNCFIYNLNINRFRSQTINGSDVGGNGIVIESDSQFPNNGHNTVYQNYLGTDPTGSLRRGNEANGVLIFDADNNGITQNLLSGNGTHPIWGDGNPTKFGNGVSVIDGNSNGFNGNIIGLNAQGNAELGNFHGIFLTGANNEVGNDFGGGNTISGNGVEYDEYHQCIGFGIYNAPLYDDTTLQLLTFNNTVRGNKIGTDLTGSVGLGNCWRGIQTYPIIRTTIGSISDAGRNTISGNGLDAVWCGDLTTGADDSQGGSCLIAGNNIGTDATGTQAVWNSINNIPIVYPGSGVVTIASNFSLSAIGSPGGTTPDGPCTGFCNLISGNYSNGVDFDPEVGLETGGPGVTAIFNNYIGTNKEGTQALPNLNGVYMYSTIVAGAAPMTFLGGHGELDGQQVSAGNLISGNQAGGTLVSTNNSGGAYLISGNRIGTDATGTSAVPNGSGLRIGTNATNSVQVGDPDPLGRNIISGNSNGDGIYLFSGINVGIYNDLIGVNKDLAPLGNSGNGINISQLYAFGTTVNANVVANNGGTGVRVNGGNAFGNSIHANSIYDNGALGIDLNAGNAFNPPDGVTPNDCLDADLGPNLTQNYPLLFTPTFANGTTTVTGYLRSSPGEEYTIEFFSNPSPDPSQFGEGKQYIGSTTIRTTGNGFTTFTYSFSGTADNITATATDSFGDTSEFSCVAGACQDPVRPVRNVLEAEAAFGFDTSVCADPIVVNEDGDLPDDDINDGVCDSDVNTVGSQCTLRAALEEAQHQPGPNAITFLIPGAGPFVIAPSSPYPELTQPVSIDATTQPGYAGSPLITVWGTYTTNSYGFKLSGGTSLIRGLAVVDFKEQIGITNSGGVGNNRITGNWIGILASGVPGTKSRQQFGITLVGGASNNRIGGTSAEDRNVISGNQVGVSIVSGSTNNQVLGNFIGTNPAGSAALPNDYGISIGNANSNQIGSVVGGGTNVISANVISGVELTGTSSNNKVSGNFIGTDVNGTSAIGNKRGVDIYGGATNNIIGGTSEPERNVISGQNDTNNGVGVLIEPDAGDSNRVSGNYIGVSPDGAAAVRNRVGIAVNADNQIIGSTNSADFKNVIVSAGIEGGYGIYLHPVFPNDELYNVTVQNNLVGTTQFDGAVSGYVGIFLLDNVKSATVKDNVVGNQFTSGIRLEQGPHNNTISGNLVGIDNSDSPIPNFNGIVVKQADTNFVKNNVVSGNTEHGIVVGDGFGQNDLPAGKARRQDGGSSFAIQNIITGNKVGTNIAGDGIVANGAVGIGVAANARDNTVGGPGGDANIVGGSVGDFGIAIFVGLVDDSQPPEIMPQNNKVVGNRVGIGSDDTLANLGNRYGIYVRNALGTTVGGDVASKGNIVCNNEADGIRLFKPGTTDTTVWHNFVGVLPDGTISGNGGDGISVDGTGTAVIQENSVGGNQGTGISIKNLPSTATGTRPTRPTDSLLTMIGNSVGTVFVNGEGVVVPNLAGLTMIDVSDIQVGAANSLANIFSGNNGPGVTMLRGARNKLENMLVGTDSMGAPGLGNAGPGVKVEETVGAIFSKLTVAGNNDVGILAQNMPPTEDESPSLTVSETNVGVVTLADGSTVARSNTSDGMQAVDVHKLLVGVAASVGQRKNIFSANEGKGLVVQNTNGDAAASGTVNHSIFGTDVFGAAGLGNHQGGMELNNALNIIVGSVDNQLKVICSGNPLFGMKIDGQLAEANRAINSVFGISPNGMDGLGNDGPGIILSEGAHNNMVGGQGEGEGNQIAFNTGVGVRIDETAGAGNVVDPNSIYSNGGLGIDIGPLGHNQNDPGDADEGANRGQNYPEILTYGINGNGELIVTYRVDTDPANATYFLYNEFFIADANGQGKTFLAYDLYFESDFAAGMKTIDLGLATDRGWEEGDVMTASSTDGAGNTSEFFPTGAESTPTPTPAITPTTTPSPTPTPTITPTPTPTPTPMVSISGRVTYADPGMSVANVTMTLTAPSFTTRTIATDQAGNYLFTNLPAGNDYTVTPSKTGEVNGLESFDASGQARFVAGLDVPTANQLFASDADGDGVVSSYDASLIARYVAGLGEYANVGMWKFVPASRTYAALVDDRSNQNFAAVLVGEVTGNWSPGGARPEENRLPAPSSALRVALPVLYALPGSTITVPIEVGELTARGARSFDLQVTYDSSVLQPQAVPYDTSGTLSLGTLVTANATNSGHLIVSAFRTTDLSGSGTLIRLRFVVVGRPAAFSVLSFDDYTDANELMHPGFKFNSGQPAATVFRGGVHVAGITPTSPPARLFEMAY